MLDFSQVEGGIISRVIINSPAITNRPVWDDDGSVPVILLKNPSHSPYTFFIAKLALSQRIRTAQIPFHELLFIIAERVVK